MAALNRELGRHGEAIAAEFLKYKGYKEIGRNIRHKIGEIDLLMQTDEALVMVEVKTQSSDAHSHPIFKINPLKQKKLRQLAYLLASKFPDFNIQVDAVGIYWKPNSPSPFITHLANVLTF